MLKFAGPGTEEMRMASGAGKIGPKTLTEWHEGVKEPLKGFEELVELMDTPATEPAKAE